MRKLILLFFQLIVIINVAHAQIEMPPRFESSLVKLTEEGKLIYAKDAKGNTIPDFSRVGYHHGNKTLPLTTSVTKMVYPTNGGDDRKIIQDAIDEVGRMQPDHEGHRGTILLKKGTYCVDSTIYIKKGGIILMGEGSNINETRIIATGRRKYNLIQVEGDGDKTEVKNSRTAICDDFVPVGSFTVTVQSVSPFSIGDRIILYRPASQQWIHDLKMDSIGPFRTGLRQWQPGEYHLKYEREIVKIEGNTLYMDNPVVMQMDSKYGRGSVYKYTFEGRIQEVGIANLCLESEYVDCEDVNHGWKAISFDKVENCWVKGVTARHFGYSVVSCEVEAKNVTVTDCSSQEQKSVIIGGNRYAFNNCGQQNLFMNCTSTESRHDFVTGRLVCGPNVFYNCTAIQSFSDIGPHHRWASGTLYDNVVTDGEINVQDRGNWGTGHGWAGVTQVLWNCRAKTVTVQSPWVTGDNYCIGVKAEKSSGRLQGRPDGFWEGQNEINVYPRSLYLSQLMDRLKYR